MATSFDSFPHGPACASCGATLAGDQRYCLNCGDGQPGAPGPGVRELLAVPPEAPALRRRRCTGRARAARAAPRVGRLAAARRGGVRVRAGHRSLGGRTDDERRHAGRADRDRRGACAGRGRRAGPVSPPATTDTVGARRPEVAPVTARTPPRGSGRADDRGEHRVEAAAAATRRRRRTTARAGAGRPTPSSSDGSTGDSDGTPAAQARLGDLPRRPGLRHALRPGRRGAVPRQGPGGEGHRALALQRRDDRRHGERRRPRLRARAPTPPRRAGARACPTSLPGTVGDDDQAAGTGCLYSTDVFSIADLLGVRSLNWHAYAGALDGAAPCPKPVAGAAFPAPRIPFLAFHTIIDDRDLRRPRDRPVAGSPPTSRRRRRRRRCPTSSPAPARTAARRRARPGRRRACRRRTPS